MRTAVNILDLIFAVVLALFFLMSFMGGTLREAISVLGLLAGVTAAHWFHEDLAALLAPLIPDRQAAGLLSYVGIVVVGLLGGIFFSGMGDFYSNDRPSLGSRLFAGALGLVKGVAVCLALYWVIDAYLPPLRDELAASRIGDPLAELLNRLQDLGIL